MSDVFTDSSGSYIIMTRSDAIYLVKLFNNYVHQANIYNASVDGVLVTTVSSHLARYVELRELKLLHSDAFCCTYSIVIRDVNSGEVFSAEYDEGTDRSPEIVPFGYPCHSDGVRFYIVE